jgi:hypothetical protein
VPARSYRETATLTWRCLRYRCKRDEHRPTAPAGWACLGMRRKFHNGRQQHDLVQHDGIKPADLIAPLNPSSDWKLALGSLAVGAREEGAAIVLRRERRAQRNEGVPLYLVRRVTNDRRKPGQGRTSLLRRTPANGAYRARWRGTTWSATLLETEQRDAPVAMIRSEDAVSANSEPESSANQQKPALPVAVRHNRPAKTSICSLHRGLPRTRWKDGRAYRLRHEGQAATRPSPPVREPQGGQLYRHRARRLASAGHWRRRVSNLT